MRYGLICDGAFNGTWQWTGRQICQCSYAVYQLPEKGRVQFSEVELYPLLGKSSRADVVSATYRHGPDGTEVAALLSGLLFIQTCLGLTETTKLVVWSDCEPMVSKLRNPKAIRSFSMHGALDTVMKWAETAQSLYGFDVWKQTTFVWVPGDDMKKSIIGH